MDAASAAGGQREPVGHSPILAACHLSETRMAHPPGAAPDLLLQQAAQAEAITREHFARAVNLVVELFGDSHRHDVKTVTAVAQIISANHQALVAPR